MVVGARREAVKSSQAYRPGHRAGNLFNRIREISVWSAFNRYALRLSHLSRRFVKSFPALSNGFEIETELTIHALELKIPFAEEPTLYGERPEGSQSKLKTFQDG
jgi:hypothetical protein